MGVIIQNSIEEEEMEYEEVQRMTEHFIFLIHLEYFNVSNKLANSLYFSGNGYHLPPNCLSQKPRNHSGLFPFVYFSYIY